MIIEDGKRFVEYLTKDTFSEYVHVLQYSTMKSVMLRYVCGDNKFLVYNNNKEIDYITKIIDPNEKHISFISEPSDATLFKRLTNFTEEVKTFMPNKCNEIISLVTSKLSMNYIISNLLKISNNSDNEVTSFIFENVFPFIFEDYDVKTSFNKYNKGNFDPNTIVSLTTKNLWTIFMEYACDGPEIGEIKGSEKYTKMKEVLSALAMVFDINEKTTDYIINCFFGSVIPKQQPIVDDGEIFHPEINVLKTIPDDVKKMINAIPSSSNVIDADFSFIPDSLLVKTITDIKGEYGIFDGKMVAYIKNLNNGQYFVIGKRKNAYVFFPVNHKDVVYVIKDNDPSIKFLID